MSTVGFKKPVGDTSGDVVSMMTREDWKVQAAAMEPPTQAFIDGRFVDAIDGETYPCINPATGTVIAHVASCGPRDVGAAVAAARRSFEGGGWSENAPAERKRVLLRFAQLLAERADEIGLLISLEMGK